MKEMLKRLVREEEGVTMIEYGLIAALIAVAAVAVIDQVGSNVLSTFRSVRDGFPD